VQNEPRGRVMRALGSPSKRVVSREVGQMCGRLVTGIGGFPTELEVWQYSRVGRSGLSPAITRRVARRDQGIVRRLGGESRWRCPVHTLRRLSLRSLSTETQTGFATDST